MKKVNKFLLIAGALSLVVGGSVALATRSVKTPVQTKAYESITPPALLNTFSTASNQMWQSNNDPAAGQSSDQSVYSTALNSSTSGYMSSGSAILPITTGTDGTQRTFLKVASSGKITDFRAEYVPFRIGLTLNAYRKYNYKFTFEVSSERFVSSSGGGGADHSAELFHFGHTSQTPISWFYHRGDFTESTGRGFSKIRAAGENSTGAGVTKTVTIEFSLENHTGTQGTFYEYFGLFCYVESSSSSGSFTGQVLLKSALVEATNAVASVNGTNCYTGASAISTYNATAGSTMTLLSDIDLSDTHYALTSSYGTVNFSGHIIDLGNRVLYVRASTTFDGVSNSKVVSSFAFGTICMDQAATLTLSGAVSIVNTCTDTLTARAVLLSHSSAYLYVGSNNFIISKYYGVQIDDGRLYLAGRIQSQNNSYSVYIGSSDTAIKYVYLYGSSVQCEKLMTNNLAKTYIYAVHNSTNYSSSYNVTISVSPALTTSDLNKSIVKDGITDDNYTKFKLDSTEFTLVKSNSTMKVAYKSYNVTYSLTNLTQTGGTATASRAANLSFTLAVASGGNYRLPSSITITVSGSSLVAGTGYTYNSTTGAVVVYKEYITGYVVISATAITMCTINFYDQSGNVIYEQMVVAKNSEITFPFPTVRPAYHDHASVVWYSNPEFTGSGFNYGSRTYITTDKDFYAKMTQTSLDEIDEFVGIQLHFDVDPISVDDERDTGACRGENGYYAIAKAVYNGFTSSQKQTFNTDATYAQAKARFLAWARANGQTINGNYNIVNASAPSSFDSTNINNEGNAIVVVSIIAAASVISLLALVILKKKHHK